MSKSASGALKYFEPIVQYFKIEKCFCFCSHCQSFNYELDNIAFRARQFYWGSVCAILVSNYRTDTVGSTTSKVFLTMAMLAMATLAAIVGFATTLMSGFHSKFFGIELLFIFII